MYHRSKLAGSVIITLKRCQFETLHIFIFFHWDLSNDHFFLDYLTNLDDGRTKPIPRGESTLPEPEEYSCIYRASLRNKKISTVVCNHKFICLQYLISICIR